MHINSWTQSYWFLCPGLLWWTEKCLMFSGQTLPDTLATSRLNLTPDTCRVPLIWTCSWADRPMGTCEMSSHRPTMTQRHGKLLHTISLSYILSAWRSMSLNVKWKCESSYMFTLMWIWNILQCNYRRQDVTSIYAQYHHRFIWRWFEVHRIMVAYWILKGRTTEKECVHINSAIPELFGIWPAVL